MAREMKITLADIERLDEIPDAQHWLTNGVLYLKWDDDAMKRLLFVARFHRREKGEVVRLVEIHGGYRIYWTCQGKNGPRDPKLAILAPIRVGTKQTEAEKKARAAEFGKAWRERKRASGMCPRCGSRKPRKGFKTCGC